MKSRGRGVYRTRHDLEKVENFEQIVLKIFLARKSFWGWRGAFDVWMGMALTTTSHSWMFAVDATHVSIDLLSGLIRF